MDAAVRQNHGKFFRFTDQGVPTKIPVFWDPTFLAKKKALIAALGAHFTNNATVTIAVVSFANATSEDWNVPHTADLIPQWLRLGYTSALMVDAGAQLIGATLDAFPNQYATLAEGGDGNTLDPDKTYVARTAIAAARLMPRMNSYTSRTGPSPSGAIQGGGCSPPPSRLNAGQAHA